jgi:carbonic anhydrase
MKTDNLSARFTTDNKIKESDLALLKLKEGNIRFAEDKCIHPNQTSEHRMEVAKLPRPFAVILSCSDSRVPPEIIFDCGIGDLFVIRVAGNVLNNEIAGSIEYAVEYFGAKLIVVMGHSGCGAVTAAVQGGQFPGHISSLADAIQPALEKAKKETGDLIVNTINKNVELMVGKLKSPPSILMKHVQAGKLKITGAYYDMENGKVTFLNSAI